MKLYISGIYDFIGLNGLELITEGRRGHINKLLQAEDKARSLVAGLMLRNFCGVINDEDIIRSDKNKPYLTNGNMFFSVSHSGDYVILFTADTEVGADIEKMKPYSEGVSKRCFTPEEYGWFQNRKVVFKTEAFYRLWTAKEAVMKATGRGFSLSPQSFDVLNDVNGVNAAGKVWFLKQFIYNEHAICLAAKNKFKEENIHETKESFYNSFISCYNF